MLIAPHVFAEAPGLASIAEARRAYQAGDLRAKLAKYHAHVDGAFCGWNGAWLDPGFKAWNIEDFVGRWRVPALLIQGADDQYGTLEQIRAIEAQVAGARREPHPRRLPPFAADRSAASDGRLDRPVLRRDRVLRARLRRAFIGVTPMREARPSLRQSRNNRLLGRLHDRQRVGGQVHRDVAGKNLSCERRIEIVLPERR